jgi:hypothetical protein
MPAMTAPRLIALTLALSASTLGAAPSFADSNMSSIEVEFQHQKDRIDEGIRTRQVTRSEAVALRNEQDQIARMIARARSDGRVSPSERREIEKAQAIASKHIYVEKHDSEVAVARETPRVGYWHRPHWWNRYN